jgi:hypothetical protein
MAGTIVSFEEVMSVIPDRRTCTTADGSKGTAYLDGLVCGFSKGKHPLVDCQQLPIIL